MKILKRAVEGSQARWTLEDGEPTLRDQEFRRTLEPSQDPARTLKKLVEYSLRQIAQRAADDWALLRFQKTVGKPSAQILVHGQKRERILAADFARGRSAMTRSERLAFERLMKSPFRYTRQMPGAGSEPVYDAELPAP